ncbi:MAG: hypothetical protein KAS32_24280 [Candidatus Peribacteraceae bacterium]|nr:hypothetical protein [Candidatus Peribacteraceae bacterium]
MPNDTIEYLKKCDQAYHNTGVLEVSDKEYDILKRQAKDWYPDDPYFQTVGTKPTGSTVSLPYILGSLTKTKHDGSLLKWCRDNNIEQVTLSDKMDGVSLYAKYIDGQLIQASTRGDGYEGKDITEKVRCIRPTIEGVGLRELRGEAVMTSVSCHTLGYSLPRSAVSGILNGDDKEHYDKCKYVDIVFYNLMGETLPTYPHHFHTIIELGCLAPEFISIKVTDDIEDKIADWFKTRKEVSIWDIDGVVVADRQDATVGEDYYPINMCAFKVNEEAIDTPVVGVEWNISRTGRVVPTVIFETIDIGGSKISRATGFNAKFIHDNQIGIDTIVGIVKSGDVIPYIENVTPNMDNEFKSFVPTNCPSCDSPLERTESGVDIVCKNHDRCPEQMIYKIEHFLLAHDVEEITATTIRRLGIKSIEDLYSLTDFGISMIEGMGIKKGQTIIREIQKTLKTTPEKLLKSFGISGIGNTASGLIMNHFGDFDTLFSSSVGSYKVLDGIGDVLAENIVWGLSKYVNLYEFLKKQGLVFEEKASMDLQGKIFTLTGKSDLNRNDLVKMITSHGGMVKGISKNVNYLVTNDTNSTSGKMKKAIQYGVEIISYDDLLSIIN